jgi:hypothetical protein
MVLADGDLGSANGRSGLQIARHGPGMVLVATETLRAESTFNGEEPAGVRMPMGTGWRNG